jgi:hypothetical protein
MAAEVQGPGERPERVMAVSALERRPGQLVNDLDPKLTAAALGMRDSGLVLRP